MGERQVKGYQFQWFRYHWEGGHLDKEASDWEMCHVLFTTLDDAKEAAVARAKEDHTQVRALYFNGEDWEFVWNEHEEPDFEKEMEYFGSWTKFA